MTSSLSCLAARACVYQNMCEPKHVASTAVGCPSAHVACRRQIANECCSSACHASAARWRLQLSRVWRSGWFEAGYCCLKHCCQIHTAVNEHLFETLLSKKTAVKTHCSFKTLLWKKPYCEQNIPFCTSGCRYPISGCITRVLRLLVQEAAILNSRDKVCYWAVAGSQVLKPWPKTQGVLLGSHMAYHCYISPVTCHWLATCLV